MNSDFRPPTSSSDLERLATSVDALLVSMAADHPAISGVEAGPMGERRWYMRMVGEQKATFSIWFHLDQRNLHFDTYFMPYPEENEAETLAYLLRRAKRWTAIGLVIGEEEALYWRGAIPHAWISAAALDDVIGSLYMATEACFRPAMRLARFIDL